MAYCLDFGLKNFFVLLSSANVALGQFNPFDFVLILSLLGLLGFLVVVGR